MPEIRPATSRADRRAVLEVSQAATRPDESRLWFQALRLRNPRRHEAAWWLLEEDGRAVSSLVCYPLRFARGNETADGYGLGAVATRPEARRRGRAAALCRRVIGDNESQGRRIGLLYSAIAPAYYERLGFAVAPAWEHACDDAASLAESGERADLVPLDPRERAGELSACYRRTHTGLCLFRDEREWLRGLARDPDDVFFGIGETLRGYLRLYPRDAEALEVVECVVPAGEEAAALRAGAALAAEVGRRTLRGWFGPVPELGGFFRDLGRARTLPMVRGARGLDDARFWASDYF